MVIIKIKIGVKLIGFWLKQLKAKIPKSHFFKIIKISSLKINIINQPDASISKVGDAALMVPSNGMVEGVYFVEIPKDQIVNTKTSITIGIYRGQELLEKVSTNFLGPE